MCLIPETKVSSFHELFLYGNDEDDANDIELGLHTNRKITSKIMNNSLNYEQKFWLATRDIHGNVDYNVGAVLAIIRHSPILYLLGKCVFESQEDNNQKTHKLHLNINQYLSLLGNINTFLYLVSVVLLIIFQRKFIKYQIKFLHLFTSSQRDQT
jgi:hypothetical protein